MNRRERELQSSCSWKKLACHKLSQIQAVGLKEEKSWETNR